MVIDSHPVNHTRPVGGGGLYERTGSSPGDELQALLEMYNITFPPLVVFAGRLNLDFHVPKSGSFLESLTAGYAGPLVDTLGFETLVRNSLHYLKRPAFS